MMSNKNNKFYHRLQHLPLAFTGLSLGLCGLASAIDLIARKIWKWDYSSYHGWFLSIPFILFALIILILVTIKNIKHPKIFCLDLKNPLASSFLPTYSMTMMCIGGFLAGWQYGIKGNSGVPVLQVIGAILICLAVLIQFVLIYFFVYYVLINHKWHEEPMYGSWFVPSVGITTACTFCGRFQNNILPIAFFQAIWFFGFVTFLILFPIVTYALMFKKQPDHDKFPSIAVNSAPPNLLLASFCQTFAIPSVDPERSTISCVKAFSWNHNAFINVILLFLVSFGIVYTIILYLLILRIINITKFDYIYASITFPLAIGAISITNVEIYLNKLSSIVVPKIEIIYIFSRIFNYLSYIFTTVALFIILFITIKFILKSKSILFTKKLDDVFHICYQNKQKKS